MHSGILSSIGIGFDNPIGDKDLMRVDLIEKLVSQFGDRLFASPNFPHIASMLYQYPAVDVLAQHKEQRYEHDGYLVLGLWHCPPRDRRWGKRTRGHGEEVGVLAVLVESKLPNPKGDAGTRGN